MRAERDANKKKQLAIGDWQLANRQQHQRQKHLSRELTQMNRIYIYPITNLLTYPISETNY